MVCLDGFDPFGILSVGFSTIVNCGWLLVCMHGTLHLSAMKRPLLISISCFFTRMLLIYPKKSLRVFNVDALYAIIRILKYRFCKLLSYLVDSGYHFYKYNVLCFGWQTHIMRSKAERKGERRVQMEDHRNPSRQQTLRDEGLGETDILVRTMSLLVAGGICLFKGTKELVIQWRGCPILCLRR